MNYEEKYKEALDAARYWHSNSEGDIPAVLEEIFPELRESEDDRIRKGIIRNLEYLADRAEGFVKDELKERIAWLEKQGQQKAINDTDEDIVEAVKDTSILDMVEQKPAWSDKDDSMFQSCIGAVATNDYYKGEEKEQIYDWLKSLKQRIGG